MTESAKKTGPVRYAVVGAGNIAQVAVLPAFEHAKENSKLVAIASDDASKRKALAERYHVDAAPYADLEALLRRASVDAVYIALPNSLHRAFTERCARAGVHVLCEKPMAETSLDCRAMIEVCERHDVRLMIAYRLHFEEANLRAMDLVRSGGLGEARFFSSTFAQQVRPGDIRTASKEGGGALYDMGVYCVNAARYIFAAEPTEVFGWQTKGTDERFLGVDEMTSALLRFPGDRVAQITASQGAADVDAYRVVGTEGDLRVEPGFGYSGERRHHLTVGGKTTETTFGKGDQFAPELVRFSDAILTGRPFSASGREGLADVRVLEAIARSSQTGVPVRLEPFDPGERPALTQELKKPAVRPVQPVDAPSPKR